MHHNLIRRLLLIKQHQKLIQKTTITIRINNKNNVPYNNNKTNKSNKSNKYFVIYIVLKVYQKIYNKIYAKSSKIS